MPLTITINDEQQEVVTLNPTDIKGKPVSVFGVPTWTLQSGACVITPAADGLSCLIASPDVPDTSVIAVHAEGDATVGTDPLDDTVTCIVTTADAVSLGLAGSSPTLKP